MGQAVGIDLPPPHKVTEQKSVPSFVIQVSLWSLWTHFPFCSVTFEHISKAYGATEAYLSACLFTHGCLRNEEQRRVPYYLLMTACPFEFGLWSLGGLEGF